MSSRCRNVLAAAVFLIAAGCKRESRELRPSPLQAVALGDVAIQSELQPGGAQPRATFMNPYEGNAYAISEGKRLYDWYNCSGCHFNGGGGIGPPLIKTKWIYGDEPENLFDTIVKGRPNGMPTWGKRIPAYQVWQLVTYVRSLNGKEPGGATPPRSDNIELSPANLRPPPGAKK
jgi:cytochrome c oxidase cbb3-type subunit III